MDDERARHAARRAFIRAHHPDRGGDPDRFVRGLAQFDQDDHGRDDGPAGVPGIRVVGVATSAWPVSLITAVLTRAGRRNRPRRVR